MLTGAPKQMNELLFLAAQSICHDPSQKKRIKPLLNVKHLSGWQFHSINVPFSKAMLNSQKVVEKEELFEATSGKYSKTWPIFYVCIV